MASVNDVATYILRDKGPMTAWKLQKLVYFSQAWSLAWDNRPLFHAKIEAWPNGPVVPTLYRLHKGQFKIGRNLNGTQSRSRSIAKKLDHDATDTIDAVLNFYGEKSAKELRDLIYFEDPWRHARENAPEGAHKGNVIACDAMASYYRGKLRRSRAKIKSPVSAKTKKGGSGKKKSKKVPVELDKIAYGQNQKKDINASLFKWRTDKIDLDGKWGFGKVEYQMIFGTIITRLHDFETMTWAAIMEGKSNHLMPRERISNDAQRRLKCLKIDDTVEELLQLGIDGKMRIWGLKDRNIFHLLWWDPEHTVYPVKKKHT